MKYRIPLSKKWASVVSCLYSQIYYWNKEKTNTLNGIPFDGFISQSLSKDILLLLSTECVDVIVNSRKDGF